MHRTDPTGVLRSLHRLGLLQSDEAVAGTSSPYGGGTPGPHTVRAGATHGNSLRVIDVPPDLVRQAREIVEGRRPGTPEERARYRALFEELDARDAVMAGLLGNIQEG